MNVTHLIDALATHLLRLPGIIATSPDGSVLTTLCALARDWNPVRYAE